jgi:hypothetical protein
LTAYATRIVIGQVQKRDIAHAWHAAYYHRVKKLPDLRPELERYEIQRARTQEEITRTNYETLKMVFDAHNAYVASEEAKAAAVQASRAAQAAGNGAADNGADDDQLGERW